MISKKTTLLAAALLALGGFAISANAATTNTTFQVKIAIANTCDVTSLAATDMDFGSHVFTDTNITSSSTIKIQCTSGNTFNVGLSAGTNPSTAGDITTRRMKGAGTNYVPYQLYKDSGYTTAWGNTSTDGWQTATGTGTLQTLTVYGKATPATTVPAGSYADTITATVTF